MRSFITLAIAVFFIFATVGFVVDIIGGGKMSLLQLGIVALYSGLIALGYVYAFTKNYKFIPITITIHVLYTLYSDRILPQSIYTGDMSVKWIVDGLGIFLGIVMGYIFFIIFITTQGMQHVRLRTEMNLAEDMHQTLVPDIRFTDERFEIIGQSISSQTVGGDLIDMVHRDEELICYIADVSGHGVGAGLFNGMFKTAMRIYLDRESALSEIYRQVNRALYDLKKKSMFITSAALHFKPNNEVEFLTAGHLPILRYRIADGQIEHLHIKQLVLTAQSDLTFSSGASKCRPGDLFLMVTDGLTEVTNSEKEEFGLERLEKIVCENASRPVEDLFQEILRQVQTFGRQRDDETLLIIRIAGQA